MVRSVIDTLPPNSIIKCIECGHGNWVCILREPNTYMCQRHGWNAKIKIIKMYKYSDAAVAYIAAIISGPNKHRTQEDYYEYIDYLWDKADGEDRSNIIDYFNPASEPEMDDE